MCLHMWEGWVSWNSSKGPRQLTLQWKRSILCGKPWDSSEGPRKPTLCSWKKVSFMGSHGIVVRATGSPHSAKREVSLVGTSIHSDITVNSGNRRKWVPCLQISLQVQRRRGWNTKLSYLQREMSLASDTAQSLDSAVITGTKLDWPQAHWVQHNLCPPWLQEKTWSSKNQKLCSN